MEMSTIATSNTLLYVLNAPGLSVLDGVGFWTYSRDVNERTATLQDPLSKFHDSSFLAMILAGMSAACRTTTTFNSPSAYLIGRPAVCCDVVLPVYPRVVVHDTHHILATII